MKIFEAKENLITAIKHLNALKENSCNHEPENKINAILSFFTPNVVEKLKRKLKVTKKKRAREARRRKQNKEIAEELEVKKRRKAEEVERLFQEYQEEEAKAKTEESVRCQADAVLHAVTRRKADARRVLALLPALAKLRTGRCQQDIARGTMPSAAVTEAFETALNYLRVLWEKQLEEYNTEEAGLKVMLAEGSATRLSRAERDLDAILHEWHVAMFGEGSHPELTSQELVSARSQWDQFVVAPDMLLSSGIPPGWLLPQPVEEDAWKNAVIFD